MTTGRLPCIGEEYGVVWGLETLSKMRCDLVCAGIETTFSFAHHDHLPSLASVADKVSLFRGRSYSNIDWLFQVRTQCLYDLIVYCHRSRCLSADNPVLVTLLGSLDRLAKILAPRQSSPSPSSVLTGLLERARNAKESLRAYPRAYTCKLALDNHNSAFLACPTYAASFMHYGRIHSRCVSISSASSVAI